MVDLEDRYSTNLLHNLITYNIGVHWSECSGVQVFNNMIHVLVCLFVCI